MGSHLCNSRNQIPIHKPDYLKSEPDSIQEDKRYIVVNSSGGMAKQIMPIIGKCDIKARYSRRRETTICSDSTDEHSGENELNSL